MADFNQASYNYGNGSYSYGNAAPQGGTSYASYGGAGPSYSYGGAPTASNTSASGEGGLRRRGAAPQTHETNGAESPSGASNRAVVERLDILFPKVDREFTVQTKNGGVMTMVAYGLMAVLCLTEIVSWRGHNQVELSRTVVDTSLGKKMRVNLNITFPALACEDLHLDVIDVAGDSQLDIVDTLVKKQLHENGTPFSKQEIEVDTNQHRQQQQEKDRILKQDLPENYCGPCYGAQEREDQCCQTCDDLLVAYSKKRWKTELLKFTSEQCIREGRDKQAPKKMLQGQGCSLSGYMTLNRVSGNFHIAMGEGIERDGRHIHTYLPEDAPNFNASHIIHQMSFGPEDGTEPLKGAMKIVTEHTGTTGLFQYFIKIVPTTFVGEDVFPEMAEGSDSLPSLYEEAEEAKGKDKTVETNRYFVTERFMPLMTDLLDDNHRTEEDPNRAAVHAGHSGGHGSAGHHSKQNSVLPGVFFIYEIYPFAVEIRRNSVPYSHLLIRLMATVGGVLTMVRWFDSWLYERGSKKHASR